MGWQMAAIKYEKDRAANSLLPNYNTYGRYDIPSYYESYWQTPEERYYTGLFVIQILCLISAFFLLFASVSLIYGVHTWSRYLIWPWFPCIISSILCSLAYCIMWWAGDVRDYWLALTILETIGVFINVYCVVVVMMYYRRINATTDEYEGKDRRVKYKVNRHGYSNRRDLMDSYDQGRQSRTPEQIMKSPYPNYMTPIHQPYPLYSPEMQHPPSQLPKYSAAPPYPIDSNEPIFYDREPKSRIPYETAEDPVAHWVKDQQKIERTEANSEPVSPSKEVLRSYPMQHSRSVPSMFDGTLVSHKSCRHGKHRSSSRHQRSKVRHASTLYSSDSETQTEFTRHRDGSHRRHRSKSRYSESEVTDLDYKQRPRRSRRSRNDHQSRDERERNARRRRRKKDDDDHWSQKCYKQDKDDDKYDRKRKHKQREDDSRGSKDKYKSHKHRERREDEDRDSGKLERSEKDHTLDTTPPEGLFPLSGGITIPQHIVIPPSAGERGPDGQPLPQKFQINSEITINYDQNAHNLSLQSDQHEPYRRRYPPISIQSNV